MPTSQTHDVEFPAAVERAEGIASRGQAFYFRATRLRLGLAILAGLLIGLSPLSPHEDENGWALASAVCFALAFLVELWLHRQQPQRVWATGRAVAESYKTLAWRFAAGGLPFPGSLEAEAAEDRFVRRLADVVRDTAATPIDIVDLRPTASMRALRSAPLSQRKAAYLASRAEDQLLWYERKASWNSAMAHRWSVALLTLEAIGALLALATGLHLWRVDLASAISAAIGCAVAWMAVRQYQTLSSTYGTTVGELRQAVRSLVAATDEISWERAVADAEDAISREHTLWRAQRRESHGRI